MGLTFPYPAPAQQGATNSWQIVINVQVACWSQATVACTFPPHLGGMSIKKIQVMYIEPNQPNMGLMYAREQKKVTHHELDAASKSEN
jgi:hypothetical protein